MPWRLVTIDLDGTLLPTTVFAAMARHLGGPIHATVVGLDALYEAGHMGLEACFLAEYDLFYDAPVATLHEGLAAAPWSAGIRETVAAIRASGSSPVILTDQPRWVCDWVAVRFGFDGAICTEARVRDDGRVGIVTAYNFDKRAGLEAYCRERGIACAAVAHVGNGSNDVPVWRSVGGSVAFNPLSDEVARAARVVVRSGDLRDVLPGLDVGKP